MKRSLGVFTLWSLCILLSLTLSGCCQLLNMDCKEEEEEDTPTPTPVPTPTPPNPFDSPAVCDSPYGSVPRDCRAYSPNGLYYAQEIWGEHHPTVGVYDITTGDVVRLLVVLEGYGNDLKGSAWSPDSSRVATMYHSGGNNGVWVFDVASATVIKHFEDASHFMAFYFLNDVIVLGCCSDSASCIYMICHLEKDQCEQFTDPGQERQSLSRPDSLTDPSGRVPRRH